MDKFAKRIRATVSKNLDKSVGIHQFESMNWSIFRSCSLNCKRMLPTRCKCLCCRESTRDRMLKRGFDKLQKEIEITSLLRTLRILRSDSKRKFSRISWRIFKL